MTIDLFRGKLTRLAAMNPETDAEMVTRWNEDTEYFRLLDSGPPRLFTSKNTKEWMEKRIERGKPEFLIRELESDKPIGFCALWTPPPQHGNAFVAIGIGERDYWGKGYGSDALKTLVRYGFLELNLHRVSLGVFEYNARAIKAYEKVGFKMEGRERSAMLRDGKRWDFFCMGILRSEWVG
ncbi:MAG TPA: GNAT family protein [Thermoflexales bacterium]|nr:GNAT family protein [Thermoflexales bacterium]